MIELKKELNLAIEGLDDERVSWIDKHFVLDLKNKGLILLKSLKKFKESNEKNSVITAIKEFLIEVKPIIQEINK